MKKRFTFLIAAIAAILMMAQPMKVMGQTAEVNTVLWSEPFKGSPSSSTTFSVTTSWSEYLNPTTFVNSDASSLSYTTSNAMANSGSATNMSGAHVWLNKSVNGYIQVTGIKLYNATKVKVSWAQATSGSSTTVYYQFDGSGDFTSLSTCSGPNSNFESTELSVSNHTTIALKFFHPSSNSKNTRIDNLKLTVTEIAAPSGTTASPSISGNTPFVGNTTVTITNAASAAGADIYYTLNGDAPTTTTSETCFAYSAPFSIDATKTVKAIAKKSTDANASSVVTENFTKVTPMTVSDALTVISSLGNNGTSADQCVSGIVCTAGTLSYGAITYYISDDGTESNRLQVYKGKGLYNADFTNAGDIAVGDEVVVYGTLKKYVSGNTTTPEFDQGSYLLSKVRGPVISTSVTELTGFTYVEGHGPSTTQTVSVSGSNLTANISLSLGDNSNFEMCLSQDGNYSNSLTLNQSNGTVSATNVYVRLKSGLSKANNYAGTITLTSTDATNKTVSLSGSVTGQTYAIEQYSLPATAHGTISFSPESPIEAGTEVTLTADPAEGYEFTADSWVFYKESGNEIVEDNSITVTDGKITMPAYDLWVDATFAPKQTFVITCSYNNQQGSLEAAPTSAYEGQTVTLTYSENTNYELDAITLTHTDGGAVAQGVTLTKGEGSTYTFNMPGYAVTATATFVSTIFEGAFEPYTDDIVEGDYIIYASSGAMKNSITSNRFDNGEVSIQNNAITDPKNTVVWHIAKIGNTNYWSIYNARVNKYAGGTSSKNQGALYDDTDDLAKWTITYDNGFVFYNYGRSQANGDSDKAYLRQNGSSGWGTYASNYGNAPTLYKLVEATAPEWSALPTPSIKTYENYELDLNELVSGTPAPEITVVTSATGYNLEDGVFTFYTETAGEYTFTFTAENSVNTAEATLTVTVTASQYAKAFLTSDNMSNMTGSLAYGSEKTFTSVDGRYTWKTTGYQGQTNRLACIQLKSASSPYILLPNINGRITTIEFDVTDANSSSLDQGNSTSTQLKFRSSATGSDIATGGDGSTSVKKITIDLTTGNFYSTGYIVSGGGIRVWNITVNYLPYDNFTDLDPEAPMPTLVAGDNYAVPEDMSATDLEIPATAGIVVKSGATLTVTGTLTNNGSAANLIIEDGGQLKFFDNNAKDGLQATVQKNITGYGNDNSVKTGWNFIASPITESIAPSAVTNLLGEQIADNPVTYNYDLYRLSGITEGNHQVWENYHQHNGNADPFMLANGQGYLYAKSSNTTLSFVGTIKPYDDTYEISVSKGWNLIGNPYTFDAYANVAYYAMNEAGTGITATTVATSTAAKPCTGIIIYAEDNGNVKFLNSAPSGSANNGNLQMVLAHNVATRDGASVNKTIDNAIVSFNEGTKLQKFYFGEPAANIFIPQNGEDYAIAFSNRQGDMPLNFKTTEAGMYTISFEGDNMDLKGVCLIDMLAEEEIDLSVDPSYTFIGSPADKAERFKIVFRGFFDGASDEIFAFQSGSDIIVSGEGELQIFDVMGRKVKTQYVSGVQTVNVNAQGVYIMKLNEKTQKIIVR